MDWRVYLGDGSTFDSDMGEPNDVPGWNVQAIVQPDREKGAGNVGSECLRYHDYYYWHLEECCWAGGDRDGVMDLLLAREPITAVCQGRRIPTARFREIEARALNDPRFPRKSARKRGELP